MLPICYYDSRGGKKFMSQLSTKEIDKLYDEAKKLNTTNIRSYPCSRTVKEDYLSLSNNFGRDAATQYILPFIHYGKIPLPSETLND